jgi:uroporphyrin-III C-methyltransferase
VSTLAGTVVDAATEGVSSPAVIVIGEVVRLAADGDDAAAQTLRSAGLLAPSMEAHP